MPIHFQDQCAVLSESVRVDEADALLAWLQDQAEPSVDLSACEHLHPAALQVLMAARVSVLRWPDSIELHHWLASALPATQALER